MVWLMLALAFGIIIGNIMLVKHTANMKMPSLKDHEQKNADSPDSDESDDHDWDRN
ncbi:DUF2897 family protein [Pseudidiomarina taiwanensis]|uniref:DUF2897 domain-containing protein n=1 Tax=Pseudidiomarina taiwanensis TaxID=337250 RepID=A0A432ZMT5_9GAMM|nr:DUF2897 family protein [Pseudidiomarina taiwanensis]RUO79194.1 DUF2897 domain-containing protein [Pseudidiomarina taiwanensis]